MGIMIGAYCPNPKDLLAMNRDLDCPRLVFVVGGPGSGKSHCIERVLLPDSGLALVDSDIIARHMPICATLDEKYSAGKEVATWLLRTLLESRVSAIVHATGASYQPCARWIKEAKDAGYHTAIVWVQCSRETAWKRNEKRTRPIPMNIFEQRWNLCDDNIVLLLEHADEVSCVSNY